MIYPPTDEWPSGLRRTPGTRVDGNVSQVRILSHPPLKRHPTGCFFNGRMTAYGDKNLVRMRRQQAEADTDPREVPKGACAACTRSILFIYSTTGRAQSPPPVIATRGACASLYSAPRTPGAPKHPPGYFLTAK